jgi:murein DD-endopeptidase MepM/ murein hydrolase activator NlpD
VALKKVTIIILPDGVNSVKQLKIPKMLFGAAIVLIFSTLSLLGWACNDYYRIKSQIPLNAQLKEENRQQKAQLASLANKIDKINSKMVELKQFDNKLKIMVNLEPGDDNTPFLGVGGSDPSLMNAEYSIEKAHQKLVRLMHQSLDNLDTEIAVQTQEKSDLYNRLNGRKSMFACTPSIWPARGWVSSKFGYRISPFTNEKEFHNGLDVAAKTGSSIIAPADGVITDIEKTYGFGNLLTVSHGYGLKTRYGHLSKILVKKGQTIKRGETIANMGSTGRSTGPHLHYEIYLEGVPVDPSRYILN